MNVAKIKFINLFFILYFLLGLLIYKDFGIGIEEHFQRQNGFYWLKEILIFLNFDNLAVLAAEKFQAIRLYDPDLPNSNFFNFYGIAFDVPVAFIELIFKIDDSKVYFELRHLINFIIFFISSIFFYKIIKKRFNNETIANLGTIFYIFNPRIFGDSFHNNKDVFFLSILTISIYFLFNYFEKNNLKNLILFCLFSAIATSSRIVGIYLPLLLIIFLFFEYLSNKITINDFIKKKLLILFFFILSLYLHFPYIWELNIFKFIEWFKVYFYNMDLRVFFDGKYYLMKHLPRLYLPKWIFITTPNFILFLLIGGYFLLLKRFICRILNINLIVQPFNDLWRSINEKKDLFIFISLTAFFFFAVLLNVALLSGWRHFYFLHIFIVYISVYLLNLFLIYCQRKKINIFFFKLVNLIFVFFILNQIFVFHPFQSLYFNAWINDKNIMNFPVDTPSLSRSDAIKFIVSVNKNIGKLSIANASWTPLYNGKDLLNDQNKKKLVFVGQEYNKADYIYTNFNYDVDPKFNKKYNIPIEFKEIKKKLIKGIPIYSIYERIK